MLLTTWRMFCRKEKKKKLNEKEILSHHLVVHIEKLQQGMKHAKKWMK